MHFNKIVLALAAAGFASGAYATNGMNLEGYGPISLGMGGTGFAFDSGTAATMINPATLALMADGARLDVAVGGLHPDINVKNSGIGYDEDSDGTAYYMPAIGYARKSGKWTYGVGLFAQGGMGAEYDDGLGTQYVAGGYSAGTVNPMHPAYGMFTPPGLDLSDWEERSEVGVGRFILPLAYQANDQFTVGGSLDLVWAMMDLKMAMPGGQMAQMMGAGLISGSLVDALNGMQPSGPVPAPGDLLNIYGGYFDFSDSSDFTGDAKGWGMAGKLGFTWKPAKNLTIGGTYHTKTNLDDLENDTAKVSMAVQVMTPSGPVDTVMTTHGKIKIKDFQWPETYGLGAAWQATDKLLLAADWKRISWADVMEDFKMTYTTREMTPDGSPLTMDATMPQDWDDQDVISLGGAYAVNDKVTVRAGYNHASNPIPKDTLHYLFPATVEDHWTLGFGYVFDKASDFNAAVSIVPSNEEKMADGTKIDHSQVSWQMMYSHRF